MPVKGWKARHVTAFTSPFQSFLKFSWLKLGLQKLGGFDVSLKDSKIKRTRKPLNAAAFTGNVLSPSSFRISLILAWNHCLGGTITAEDFWRRPCRHVSVTQCGVSFFALYLPAAKGKLHLAQKVSKSHIIHILRYQTLSLTSSHIGIQESPSAHIKVIKECDRVRSKSWHTTGTAVAQTVSNACRISLWEFVGTVVQNHKSSLAQIEGISPQQFQVVRWNSFKSRSSTIKSTK